jgi:hypothetical protein
MKAVIVGGVADGASTAARLRRNSEEFVHQHLQCRNRIIL